MRADFFVKTNLSPDFSSLAAAFFEFRNKKLTKVNHFVKIPI